MATASTPIESDATGHGVYVRDTSAAADLACELGRRPFLLSETLSAIQRQFAARARAKGLAFEVSLPVSAHDAVVGDDVLLRQVLSNLVGNAVKFTAVGAIEVAAKQRTLIDGSLLLTFAVKDTGPGIGRERLPLLFKPSGQTDAAAHAGIAVSSGLVRAMGGTLEVTSIPGEGSIFAFYIRVGRARCPGPATRV